MNLYRPALETIQQKVRESTSSKTSVPKPLKFMRRFYGDMTAVSEKIRDPHNKVRPVILIIFGTNQCLVFLQTLSADIVSLLAMTSIDTKKVLKYR